MACLKNDLGMAREAVVYFRSDPDSPVTNKFEIKSSHVLNDSVHLERTFKGGVWTKGRGAGYNWTNAGGCESVPDDVKPTLSPFIHTTLGAGSPLMGISSRSLFPATIVTVLSGKFRLSRCTFGGSAQMKNMP